MTLRRSELWDYEDLQCYSSSYWLEATFPFGFFWEASWSNNFLCCVGDCCHKSAAVVRKRRQGISYSCHISPLGTSNVSSQKKMATAHVSHLTQEWDVGCKIGRYFSFRECLILFFFSVSVFRDLMFLSACPSLPQLPLLLGMATTASLFSLKTLQRRREASHDLKVIAFVFSSFLFPKLHLIFLHQMLCPEEKLLLCNQQIVLD